MAKPIVYTIGHSNQPLASFEKELAANGIKALVDVRSLLGSKASPWFDSDTLPQSLAKVGIKYTRIALLGGFRGRDYNIDPRINGFWKNTSFFSYANYATTKPFMRGIHALERIARRAPTVYMCAEAVWWRCHRRIISDWMMARGWDVQNIMSTTETNKATYNPGAVVKDGRVTYPGNEWAEAHPRAAAHQRYTKARE